MKLVLWACAVAFFFEQNSYFGWNGKPHSDAELIADGITILLVALAALGSVLTGD